MRHEVALPHDRHAAAMARELVVHHTAHLPADVVDGALLLVSELVSNAVVHGSPDVVFRLDVTAASVAVEVVDGADVFDVDLRPVPATQASGRGLLLVAALAERWGLRPQQDGGKSVWFELAGT